MRIYIFIHVLKCFLFCFKRNKQFLDLHFDGRRRKHPWSCLSCLFCQLSLFFLSFSKERCGNFVSTRKGHLNTSKGSSTHSLFLEFFDNIKHHEFVIKYIDPILSYNFDIISSKGFFPVVCPQSKLERWSYKYMHLCINYWWYNDHRF